MNFNELFLVSLVALIINYQGKVIRVIDGDTIVALNVQNQQIKVRLEGDRYGFMQMIYASMSNFLSRGWLGITRTLTKIRTWLIWNRLPGTIEQGCGRSRT